MANEITSDEDSMTLSDENSKRIPSYFRLLDLGYTIFPVHYTLEDGSCSCGKPNCKSVGKHPNSEHGHLDATGDEIEIADLDPVNNIGARPGLYAVVIDLDQSRAKRGIAHFCQFTGLSEEQVRNLGFVVETPTGGLHIYCTFAPELGPFTNRAKLIPGVDIRTHDGYVVGPSSKIGDKFYRIISNKEPVHIESRDDVLYKLLSITKTRTIKDMKGDASLAWDSSDSVHYLRERLKITAPAIEGEGGDHWTYAVCCLGPDYGVSAGTLFDLLTEDGGWNSRCSPPWDTDDLSIKIQNAYRYRRGGVGGKLAWDLVFAERLPGERTVYSNGLKVSLIGPDSLLDNLADVEQALYDRGDIYSYGGMAAQVRKVARRKLVVTEKDVAEDYELTEKPRLVTEARDEETLAIVPLTPNTVPVVLSGLLGFEKYNAKGETVRVQWTPPDLATKAIETPMYGLRRLTRIVNVPLLLLSGEVIQEPGYNAKTETYYVPPEGVIPKIPNEVSKDQAVDACDTLLGPFSHFRFESEAGKSVVLTAILTALIRPLLPSAPMFVFTSPMAGSGKGLLVQSVAEITTGGDVRRLTPNANQETTKTLHAALLEGSSLICIDNLSAPLYSDTLCIMLTEPSMTVRELGLSRNHTVSTASTIMVTGRNVSLIGDLNRRALICSVDPGVEDPHKLTFAFNPVERCRTNRNLLITAALTVLKGYLDAGRPLSKALTPLGSFTDWNVVREAIVWLGNPDPAETMQTGADVDSEKGDLRDVLELWQKTLGERWVRAVDIDGGGGLMEQVEGKHVSTSGLKNAILGLSSGRDTEALSTKKRIGQTLTKFTNVPVGGLKIVIRRDTNKKVNVYQVRAC